MILQIIKNTLMMKNKKGKTLLTILLSVIALVLLLGFSYYVWTSISANMDKASGVLS